MGTFNFDDNGDVEFTREDGYKGRIPRAVAERFPELVEQAAGQTPDDDVDAVSGADPGRVDDQQVPAEFRDNPYPQIPDHEFNQMMAQAQAQGQAADPSALGQTPSLGGATLAPPQLPGVPVQAVPTPAEQLQADAGPVLSDAEMQVATAAGRSVQGNQDLASLYGADYETRAREAALGNAQAGLDLNRANAGTAEQQGEVFREAAITEGKAALELEQRQQRLFARHEELMAKMDRYEIDPNRVWKNKGTLDRAFSILGLAYGSFAQLTTGRNMALEIINKEIERDIDAQKSNFDILKSRMDATGEAMNLAKQVYGDGAQARTAERALRLNTIEQWYLGELNKPGGVMDQRVRTQMQQDLAQISLERRKHAMEALGVAHTLEKDRMSHELRMAQTTPRSSNSPKKTSAVSDRDARFPREGDYVFTDGPNKGGSLTVKQLDAWLNDNGKSRDKMRESRAAVENIHDVVASFEKIDVSTWDEIVGNDQTARQLQAMLRLSMQKAVAGNLAESEQQMLLESIIGTDVTSFKNILRDRGKDEFMRSLRVFTGQARMAFQNNYLPPGVSWSGLQGKPVPGAVPARQMTGDEARDQVRKSGLQPTAPTSAVEAIADVKVRPDKPYTALRQLTEARNDLQEKKRQLAGLLQSEVDPSKKIDLVDRMAAVNAGLARVDENLKEYQEKTARAEKKWQGILDVYASPLFPSSAALIPPTPEIQNGIEEQQRTLQKAGEKLGEVVTPFTEIGAARRRLEKEAEEARKAELAEIAEKANSQPRK